MAVMGLVVKDDSKIKDEVRADLEDAGLRVEDMDLFLAAMRRWCNASYEDEEEMPEDDEGDDGGPGMGLAAKLRK